MMVGHAPDGRFLSVSPDRVAWHLRLTKAHRDQRDEFALCHGKTLTAADVGQFLPNWDSLQWSHRRRGVGRSNVITATDGEFRVAIITMDDCPLAEEQMVWEFKQFMADSASE